MTSAEEIHARLLGEMKAHEPSLRIDAGGAGEPPSAAWALTAPIARELARLDEATRPIRLLDEVRRLVSELREAVYDLPAYVPAPIKAKVNALVALVEKNPGSM